MTFDLTREAWIPVYRAEQGPVLVSLRDLFKDAAILNLSHVDPLVVLSLLRFLLTVVEDALDPTPAMRRAWLDKGLPYRKLYNYMEKHPFDLLEPQRPFYQIADLECSKRSSHTVLDSGGNRDNNKLVGDFTMTDDPPPISLAEAAALIIAAQTFNPVGGNSSYGYTSATPLANMPVTYGAGPTLLYELAANAGPRTLPPVWRSGLHKAGEVKLARAGNKLLHPYTPFSRMLLLHPEGDCVQFVSVAAGLHRDATGDPMVAQAQNGGVKYERGSFSLVAAAALLTESSDMLKPQIIERTAELETPPQDFATVRFQVKQGVALGVDKYEFKGATVEEVAALTRAVSSKQWQLAILLDYMNAKRKNRRSRASSQAALSALETFQVNGESLVRQHFVEGKSVNELGERLSTVTKAALEAVKPPTHKNPQSKPPRAKVQDKPVRFIERLETLHPSDLAILKTPAEYSTGSARRIATFLPRGASVWTCESYALVAHLYALNPKHDPTTGDLGSFIGAVGPETYYSAFARALQSETFVELSAAVSGSLRGVSEPVNWALLLTDLLTWRSVLGHVPERWRRNFEKEKKRCLERRPTLS